jgi:TRAP-type C4-dicarboxylate transport system permease small subunit
VPDKKTALAWCRRRAENVAAAMLAALFVTFILQIAARYVFNAPLVWTQELTLTLWLWGVFWTAAFVLSERDHVRFDVLYLAVGQGWRRGFALVSAIALSGGFVAALPATYGYVTFYQIKKSATLGIRLDIVFSVYLLFAVAIILRYAWRAVQLLRGVAPESLESDGAR